MDFSNISNLVGTWGSVKTNSGNFHRSFTPFWTIAKITQKGECPVKSKVRNVGQLYVNIQAQRLTTHEGRAFTDFDVALDWLREGAS